MNRVLQLLCNFRSIEWMNDDWINIDCISIFNALYVELNFNGCTKQLHNTLDCYLLLLIKAMTSIFVNLNYEMILVLFLHFVFKFCNVSEYLSWFFFTSSIHNKLVIGRYYSFLFFPLSYSRVVISWFFPDKNFHHHQQYFTQFLCKQQK